MIATMKSLIAIIAFGAASVIAQSSVLGDLASEPPCVISAVNDTAEMLCNGDITTLTPGCACNCAFQDMAIVHISGECGGATNATLVAGLIQLQTTLCSGNITGAATNGTCPATTNTTSNATSTSNTSMSMSASGSMSASMTASATPSSGAIALGSNGLVGAAAALFAGILAVA